MRGDELKEGGKEQKICFFLHLGMLCEKLACNPPVHTIRAWVKPLGVPLALPSHLPRRANRAP